MLAVVLPSTILLLNPASPLIYTAAVTQILSFATTDPERFKDVTSMLQSDLMRLMEDSVKQALGSRKGSIDSKIKPQISLRTFK